MKSIIKIYIIILTATLCTGAYAQDTAIKKLAPAGKNIAKQINASLSAYYELKDALVAAKAPQAKQMAALFIEKLAAIDTTTMTAEQKTYFVPHAIELKQQATSISAETDIEPQRAAFKKLSASMYCVIKSFDTNKNTVYLQYCPMADNDQGAHWLSEDEEIMNPYFGNIMLHCGSVEEEL